MKGIELPINVIVIVAIVVLVLAVVGVFFFLTSTEQLSRVDAERIFSQGCSEFCKDPCESYYYIGPGDEVSAPGVTSFHTEFFRACETLGHSSGINVNEKARSCINSCGADCNLADCSVVV